MAVAPMVTKDMWLANLVEFLERGGQQHTGIRNFFEFINEAA
jgi:hypothetical protein